MVNECLTVNFRWDRLFTLLEFSTKSENIFFFWRILSVTNEENGVDMFVEFSEESVIFIQEFFCHSFILIFLCNGLMVFCLNFVILHCQVDYQEKLYAQGLIPNTYMRREGAPKERELLCGRLIDRPIRPLFPSGFYHEVQVWSFLNSLGDGFIFLGIFIFKSCYLQIMASVLSLDGKQDPDILAANAASAALMLSDVPWGGPIGVIRLGRIDGQIVVNPTMDEVKKKSCNIGIFLKFTNLQIVCGQTLCSLAQVISV